MTWLQLPWGLTNWCSNDHVFKIAHGHVAIQIPPYTEPPLRYTRHMHSLTFRQKHTSATYYKQSFYPATRGVQKHRYTGIPRHFFDVVRTVVHLPVPRYSDDSIFSNSLLYKKHKSPKYWNSWSWNSFKWCASVIHYWISSANCKPLCLRQWMRWNNYNCNITCKYMYI